MEQERQRGNSTPQTLSHNLHELVFPELSILYLLPVLNSSALSPTHFLTKTTLNLIPSTAKTPRVFVWSPLRWWFGEKSLGEVSLSWWHVELRGFKKFSGRMEHFLEDGLFCAAAGPSCKWPGQNTPSSTPTVTLSIRELACSNSVAFPMRCGEGSKPVTVLIWLQNSLYFDTHCLKINVWNWRHYH